MRRRSETDRALSRAVAYVCMLGMVAKREEERTSAEDLADIVEAWSCLERVRRRLEARQ